MKRIGAWAAQSAQLLLALASVVLGMTGYLVGRDFASSAHVTDAIQIVLDSIFFTFKLFAGVAPATFSHENPVSAICLNIARFTAPAALILTFLARFEGLWKPALIRYRIRRLDHCDIHYGRGAISDLIASQSALEGRWTISINPDTNLDQATYGMDKASKKVELNLAALETILRFRPFRAETLLFVSDDDLANMCAVKDFSLGNLSYDTAFAHIGDENLRLDTVAAGGFTQSDSEQKAQVFSIHELVSRSFFHRNDVFLDAAAAGKSRLHIALVGFSDDVAAFFFHAIKVSPYPNLNTIKVTIFTPNSRVVEDGIRNRIGQLDEIVELNVREFSEDGILGDLPSELEDDLPQFWYLSDGWLNGAHGKALGLLSALTQMGDEDTTVFLPMTLQSLASIESMPGIQNGRIRGISDDLAPLSHQTFAGEMDRLSRKIHEAYQGYKVLSKSDEDARLKEWFNLNENFKAANRRAADAIKTKLEAIGQKGTLLSNLADGVGEIDISPELRERIAIAEHKSWMADRLISGWRFAKVRDNVRRLHPNIVPYAKLSEEDKDLDRNQLDFVLSIVASNV